MNRLLTSLSEICNGFPLDEKILVVPDYGAGHDLCEGLARYGGGWVNLHPETTAGLASLVAGDHLAENNISLLPGFLSSVVVETVFKDFEERKMIRYFARQGSSPGLIRAIASSIYELRTFGITGDDLSPDSFVSPDKGEDLKMLLKAYERYLDENKYMDFPGLIRLALNMLEPGKTRNGNEPDKIYILPSFLKLSPLETELIKKLAGDRLVYLHSDPVFGLSRSNQAESQDGDDIAAGTDVERLPWLLKLEESPPPFEDGTLDFFHAYGIANEVREILRRVMSEAIPLDNVTVACTSGEYIPVFYTLSRRMGFNLTVSGGIPASFTSPGRALKGLLEWIKKDFSARALRDLILSGDLKLVHEEAGDPIPPAAAARILRSSGIGWGRDRYRLLEALARGYLEKAGVEVEEDGGRRELILMQGELAKKLHTTLQHILSLIPGPDESGMVGFREITGSLAEIVSHFACIKDETDAAALKAVTSSLVETGRLASFEIETGEALERVESILGELSVGASGPKPGHLHITLNDSLIWSSRSVTFVCGLDADTFPGGTGQDPVLLDSERVKINGQFPLSADRPGDKRYDLALALASRRGRVVLSFSSFDVVEYRSVFPSSTLLQACRLIRGEPSLDYTNLLLFLSEPAGYCPRGAVPLDETGWWIWKTLNDRVVAGREAVRECYRGIHLGQLASEARQGAAPTEYDGVIGAGPGELDPRTNRDMVMSCSRIEYLAGCPFAYFLRHVLHIYPPDEVLFDSGRWLDTMERGSLLHRVYCNFMRKVAEKGEKVSFTRHRPLIMKIAGELIAEYRKIIPPPSDIVFNREARDIFLSCEVFLSAEEARPSDPVYFEIPFGLGKEEVNSAGGGLADPVEIALGTGGFLLSGKIDRIDRVKNGIYSVWDYKTGGTYGYEDHRHLCGGRQVQHALYAVAAEKIIGALKGEQARVEEAGYIFPTVKGEGLRVSRRQTDRGAMVEVLNSLFELLAGGVFVAADDGEKCGFCDYPEVCGGAVAVSRAKQLVSSGDPRLEPWRRLKGYE
ncbi:MAG: PD-(D/E)XK nuclease family protein [Bacillota bacterium]